MDNWTWIRFSGQGSWADRYWPCKACGLLKDGSKPPEIETITGGIFVGGKHRGAAITSNRKKWHEDIASRQLLPNGDVAIVDHKGNIKEVRPKGVSLRSLK
jgi:hypothetical protein